MSVMIDGEARPLLAEGRKRRHAVQPLRKLQRLLRQEGDRKAVVRPPKQAVRDRHTVERPVPRIPIPARELGSRRAVRCRRKMPRGNFGCEAPVGIGNSKIFRIEHL